MIPLQDLNIVAPLVEKLDTINVQNAVLTLSEKVKTTPPSELWKEFADTAINFGLKVVAAIIIYIIGVWLISRLKKGIARSMEKKNVDKSMASFIQSMVSVFSTILLIVIVIGTLGVNTTSFAAIFAALGMALGMALSGAMSNFAGGVLILIFKPFKSGDVITTQSYKGTVDSISIFSTKLITADNKVVYIPNGALSNEAIENFSQGSIRRLEWEIDTEYGTNVAQMQKACFEILAEDERIIGKDKNAPENPTCNIKSLKDSSVLFTVRAWVSAADYWAVYFDTMNKLYTKLTEKGIQFPFPQMDIHVKND